MVHLLEGGPVGDHNVDIDLYDLDGSSSTGEGEEAADGVGGGGGAARTGTEAVAPSDGRDSVVFAGVEKPPRQGASAGGAGASAHHRRRSSRDSFPHEHDVVVEISTGGSTVRPSPDLNTLQLRMAGRVQPQPQPQQPSPVSALTPPGHGGSHKASDGDGESFMEEGGEAGGGAEGAGSGASGPAAPAETGSVAGGEGSGAGAVAPGDNEKLVRMGLMTAVAIGIHNFPEGLATFVATLSDPSVGLALAVAIAIHNIPEGLCVAIPVYYATGNRWKAFGWALLSGVSEPIGAGLGWLVLKDVMSELVYGVLFGAVAGMMVNITIHELIPTAVRYDPADKVTTNSIIAGMAIMAASLTLFLY